MHTRTPSEAPTFTSLTLCADWKHSLAFLTLRTGMGAFKNIMPWMMKGAPPFSSGCLATIMSIFLKIRANWAARRIG